MARGVYRSRTSKSGAEYAYVYYGVASSIGEMPRADYEAHGYDPLFELLPTKEEYEREMATHAQR